MCKRGHFTILFLRENEIMEIVPALYLYPPSNGTRIRKWLKRIVPAGTNNDFTVYLEILMYIVGYGIG